MSESEIDMEEFRENILANFSKVLSDRKIHSFIRGQELIEEFSGASRTPIIYQAYLHLPSNLHRNAEMYYSVLLRYAEARREQYDWNATPTGKAVGRKKIAQADWVRSGMRCRAEGLEISILQYVNVFFDFYGAAVWECIEYHGVLQKVIRLEKRITMFNERLTEASDDDYRDRLESAIADEELVLSTERSVLGLWAEVGKSRGMQA